MECTDRVLDTWFTNRVADFCFVSPYFHFEIQGGSREMRGEGREMQSNYQVAKAVITPWLTAPVTRERENIQGTTSPECLCKAERTMLMSATMEVPAYIRTPRGEAALKCIAPVWNMEGKLRVTQGRLRHKLQSVLGVDELPIVLPTSRLAYLLMECAHKLDHCGPKQTMARVRSWA